MGLQTHLQKPPTVTGEPFKAVIVHAQSMGMRGSTGEETYAFVLTMMADGRAPYRTPVGGPVPPHMATGKICSSCW